MKKWICKVCGYTHHGEEAPERCPQCSASKHHFYQEKTNNKATMDTILIIMLIGALALTFFSCSSQTTVDNTVVKTVDLNRYLGRWYEIARFDHRFERDLMQCTATYTLKENGTIKVVNKGIKDGIIKTSVGKAKLTDEPGVLRVSFFGPFYSDYRILMLSPDYTYALIGGSNDNYLWILSRTPRLSRNNREKILGEAQRRGYETSNLIWVHQNSL